MALERWSVFVDTEPFVRMGLDFGHPAIRSFVYLCKKGALHHYTTTVVKREVEGKITASIDEALSSLKKFRRRARMLERIDNEGVRGLFKEIGEEEAHEKALAVYREFLLESRSTTLDTSGIDPERVLDLYFSKKPPFGSGRKKTEFPDAFSLLAVLDEAGDDIVYVVSSDPDLASYCCAHDQVHLIGSLDQLLDIYNERETKITELVKAHIRGAEDRIKVSISDAITEAGAFNEAPWEDSEVDDFSVLTVHDFNPLVVHIDALECVVVLDVEVDFEYSVTGPDFNGGYYDKEDGRVYVFGSTSHTGTDTKTFSAEITLTYEYNGSVLEAVDESISVQGISEGVALHVEENGPDC